MLDLLSLALVAVPTVLTGQEYERLEARIRQALGSRHFEVAAATLTEVGAKRSLTSDGRRTYLTLCEALADDLELRAPIQSWAAVRGAPAGAHVLRGIALVNEGWNARGAGWGYAVSDEAHAEFKRLLEEAKRELLLAMRDAPDDATAPTFLIRVSKGLGLSETTMETFFAAAVRRDSVSVKAYEEKLDYLQPKWFGSEDTADEFARSCVKGSPPASRVYTVMLKNLKERGARAKDAKAYFGQPTVKASIDSLTARFRVDFPRSPEACRTAAEFARSAGRPAEVLGWLDRAVELAPGDPKTRLERAELRLDQGSYAPARADVDAVIAAWPRRHKAFYLRGRIKQYGDKALLDARADYDRAIDLDATEASYHYSRGLVRMDLKDLDQALSDLNFCVEHGQEWGYYNYYRGKILWLLGRKAEADKEFATAARLEPKSVDWVKNLKAGRATGH